MNALSVVIPSRTLTNLLVSAGSVREHEKNASIVLVDDGIASEHQRGRAHWDSKTEPWLNPELSPIYRIDGDKPFVFSRNVNKGILFSADDDIIVMNDDAVLKTAGGLSELQRAATEHPEYGIIAATTNNVGNRNQWPQTIGLREDPRMVCFICVLIPRRTIELVGLLDERFTAYGFEDDDYCYRVRRAGLKIGVHDGCFVDHASLPSTFRGDPRKPAELGRGREIFVEKWGSYPL